MDVSCVWLCQSRLRGLTGPVLVGFACLVALTVLLQSAYLQSTIGETLKDILPAEINYSVLRAKLNSSGSTGAQSETGNITGFIYKAYGRGNAVVMFDSSPDGYKSTSYGDETRFRLFSHPKLFDSFYNGNMSVHHQNPFSYLKASEYNMYIISAFDRSRFSSKMEYINLSNQSSNSTMLSNDNIVITGWLSMKKVNVSLLCCFLNNNKTVIQYPNTKRIIWTQVKKQELMAAKIMCPIPDKILRKDIVGVSVTALSNNCNKRTFMAIENADKPAHGSIALCSKIAYGTLSAQRLMEWLEIQRYIGVDKILIYVYNLNKDAMSVLKHYAQEGLVDIVPFDVPEAEAIPRHVGQKEAQPFIDEQVVVFDCMERLRGYTYLGVMDVDEIIFSRISPKRNLKHLMERLLRRKPHAGGFRFRTEVFITEWVTQNLTSTEKLFWHSRHQNRTRPIVDRTKTMLVMDRVVLSSVWTHNYTVKPGFDRYIVPASVATLKHYRPCRENWHCNMRRGYKDISIASVVTEIKDTILAKLQALHISSTAP